MRFRIFFSVLIVFQFITEAQTPARKLYHLVIGTYTKGKSEGIYVYLFNAQTGDVQYEHTIKGVANPSYLAIAPGRKQIYSVTMDKGQSGEVSAFAFDARSGLLSYLNQQSSGSEGPCYVSVDQTGKYVFVGNYAGGGLAILPVKADGSLGASVQTIIHHGSSINKERQASPHVHAVVVSPDNHYLMVPDLGIDKVM